METNTETDQQGAAQASGFGMPPSATSASGGGDGNFDALLQEKTLEHNNKFALCRLGRGIAICEHVLNPTHVGTSPKAKHCKEPFFWGDAAWLKWQAHDTVATDGGGHKNLPGCGPKCLKPLT